MISEDIKFFSHLIKSGYQKLQDKTDREGGGDKLQGMNEHIMGIWYLDIYWLNMSSQKILQEC